MTIPCSNIEEEVVLQCCLLASVFFWCVLPDIVYLSLGKDLIFVLAMLATALLLVSPYSPFHHDWNYVSSLNFSTTSLISLVHFQLSIKHALSIYTSTRLYYMVPRSSLVMETVYLLSSVPTFAHLGLV